MINNLRKLFILIGRIRIGKCIEMLQNQFQFLVCLVCFNKYVWNCDLYNIPILTITSILYNFSIFIKYRFRECVEKMKQKYFPSCEHRIEFFPVEWRSSLKLDGGKSEMNYGRSLSDLVLYALAKVWSASHIMQSIFGFWFSNK